MPAKLSITDLAAVDTAEGRRYYGDVRPDLEARFAAAPDAALDRIADQPELFAPLFPDVRKVRLKAFPYSVYYRVRPADVEVLGILHDKRDSSVLRSRM